jgi:hypothetical protein
MGQRCRKRCAEGILAQSRKGAKGQSGGGAGVVQLRRGMKSLVPLLSAPSSSPWGLCSPAPLRASKNRTARLSGNGRWSIGLVLALAAAVPAATASPAWAATPGQQVWLISTCGVPCSGEVEAALAKIAFWQLDPGDPCRWLRADVEVLGRGAPLPTAIFIPGYNTGPDAAIQEATAVYCDMQQAAGGRPFRLLVWAWPSQRNRHGRISADVRLKASWCDVEGYYLARTLARLPAGTPVGLVAYSYGARIAGGALELLAGGQLAGRSLPDEARAAWTSGPRPVRLLLVAAAMDADWLASGRCDGDALSIVQRAAVTLDCGDRVLRWYSRLHGRGGPPALGHAGPAGCADAKVEVLDVACAVGKKHDWYRYESAVAQRLAWYTFLAGEQ